MLQQDNENDRGILMKRAIIAVGLLVGLAGCEKTESPLGFESRATFSGLQYTECANSIESLKTSTLAMSINGDVNGKCIDSDNTIEAYYFSSEMYRDAFVKNHLQLKKT